ncbi:TetR family transcriptional regulator [Verminephrobacter aporrectodeae subsp. tuberculatae]|uniref:TetR/AcrR family transcriptional regulator n=1 Tax=Verminephrobacter aporrectodeae TaxID=1110389 RepID=UPI002237B48B|nr:TetR/AcrR family transcriptional regulator [Verminephrobacter aporrectodeae]MCW5222717.1 TetR family transcriptional regulator [Verminephrobacter aporrectodeae subsp. tuberculatae]MCW5288181.1 TetR family transcriptional regulator [Verminephrobacter aporrectodeae subsp. tuberculatae]
MHTPHFHPDDAADTAMRVFWQKGYAATSIQDLVDATGLSRSSLYNTFESKYGLFQHALRRYRGQTLRNAVLLAEDGSAQARVRVLLQGIAEEELRDGNTCGCLVANTALEMGGRDPTVTAMLGEHFATLETALTALMQRGQQRGEIAREKSPVALARFLVATVQGLRVMGRGHVDADRAARLGDIIDTAVNAL